MKALSPEQRAEVEQALQRACGLTFAGPLRSGLDAAVERAAERLGCEGEALLERLRRQEAKSIAAVLEQARVGETYFFRHAEQFAALQSELFAKLGQDQRATIWCAGCASGEEPYSVAMAAAELGLSARVDILASDVSELALERARTARYGTWSLRSLELERRQRFFTERAGAFALEAPLCARVRWARHNLVTEPPPLAPVDAIFCRNVLIYFGPETVQAVLAKLADALRPGGLLFVAPAEVGLGQGLDLEWIERGGAVFARKLEPGQRSARPRTPMLRPVKAVALPRRRTPVAVAPVAVPRPTTPISQPAPVLAASASTLEQALAAARAGRTDEAEQLARELASRGFEPEPFLLLAMLAEERGALEAALAAARQALYLDSSLVMGHALMSSLLLRTGQPAAAARARRNALALLEGLDDLAPLRSLEPVTAGALRRALGENDARGALGAFQEGASARARMGRGR